MIERQSFSFTRDPKAVRDARGVLDRVKDRLPAGKAYDALLCLSELVTNAIQHSPAAEDDELLMAVELDDRALRVEVSDPGRSSFDPGPRSEVDDRGWGLVIVDRLASRWGIERGERTTVWFELEVALGATGAASADTGAAPPARGEGLLRASALRRATRLT